MSKGKKEIERGKPSNRLFLTIEKKLMVAWGGVGGGDASGG